MWKLSTHSIMQYTFQMFCLLLVKLPLEKLCILHLQCRARVCQLTSLLLFSALRVALTCLLPGTFAGLNWPLNADLYLTWSDDPFILCSAVSNWCMQGSAAKHVFVALSVNSMKSQFINPLHLGPPYNKSDQYRPSRGFREVMIDKICK